jgi:hypothetical protein
VLNPDKSCRKAVSDFVAEQSKQGVDNIASANTGPYSKARQRLPEVALKELIKVTAESTAKNTHAGWKVYGRELKTFDGTTIRMSDTEANQESFPQHSEQKKGAGFPIVRLLAVMSLTTGVVINYALGAYRGKGTGELSLLREIKESIEIDDIVLGDRAFPCYFVMADLYKMGADGVFRGQTSRKYDFRKGEKLGKNDHVARWKKPQQKPKWMDQSSYDDYPNEIDIREFKVAGTIYVSTFLRAKQYPKKELAKLYRLRWHVEINLNSIKTTLNMPMLSCKTPEMIRKEISIHLLAYNLIRIMIAEAAQQYELNPRAVSFKGTLQLLNSFMPYFVNSDPENNKRMYARMLLLMAQNSIGNRPGRSNHAE